jgi:hypothetical protein
VTDSRHFHQQFSVVDGVHHAVVADTNMPLAIATPEFLAAGADEDRMRGFPSEERGARSMAGELLEFPLST